MKATPPGVRADIWLWAARFFKTRSLAKRAIEAGRLEVNDAPAKPARALRVGDRLIFRRGEDRFEVVVHALAEARGPAAAAQALYVETEASRAARVIALEQRRLHALGNAHPPTRPDKRARRLIRAFTDPS